MGLAKSSTVVLGSSWVLVLLGMVANVLIARAIGPEGVGVVALLTATAALLSTVGGFGTDHSFLYYYKMKTYGFGQLAGVQLFSVVLFTALVFAAAFLGGDKLVQGVFPELRTHQAWIYLALSTIPLKLLFNVLSGILVVDRDMFLYAVMRIAAKLFYLFFILLLLYVFGMGLVSVLLGNVLFYAIPLIIFLLWYERHPLHKKLSFSKEVLLNLLRKGWRQYGVSLASIMTKRLPFIIIACFLATRFNGYYAIAFALAMVLHQVPESTMWPLVGELTGRDIVGATVARTTRTLLLLMCILCALAAVAAYPLVIVLYGQEFAPAFHAFRLLLPTVVASAVVTPANAYYNSIGRIGKIFPYLLPITALYVVSLFLFIPLWGIKGAAMALSIKQVILARTYLWLLAKHTNIPVRDFLIPTGEDLSLMFGLVRRGLTVMGCRR